MKPFTTVATVIFTLVALTHLCRMWYGWDVVIAGATIPMWASYFGFAIAGGLAYGLWRESRQGKS